MSRLRKIIYTILIFNSHFSIANNITQTNDSGTHSYYYNQEKLDKVLERYARNNGLKISIAANATKVINRNVNGRFNVDDKTFLIDALSKQYGFNWFIYSGTLYISSMEIASQSIAISPDDMRMLKTNLVELGILDDRFGYSEIPSENKVVITGPAAYVNIIIEQVKRFNITPVSQKFAVFKLNYAKSSDTTLNFSNQNIVIPGVATILQNMLQSNQKGKAIIESSIENGQATSVTKKDKNVVNGITSNVVIQSDDRLNAVIIRDKAANLGIYQDLINNLDVPTALIQIEVLIMHLDQTKLGQAGISWWGAAGNNGLSGGFGAANLTQANNNLNFYYGAINPGQTLVSNIQNFIVGVNFLENKKYAKVASKPSLVTTDNIPAIMNINETLWLNNSYGASVNSAAGTSTNAAFMQVEAINALQITPHVIKKNKGQYDIRLSILLEDGSLNDQVLNNANGMLKNTQASITSQAVIREGQALLVAGYTRDVTEQVTTSVPILGDIPGLGWFFKSTSDHQKKISTVYLVTPKIVWIDDVYRDIGNLNSQESSVRAIESTNNLIKVEPLNNSNATNNDVLISNNVIKAQTKSSTASTAGVRKYIIVQPNDTLYSIAKNNSISVVQLKELNDIPNDVITTGMKLFVE